MVRPRTFAAAPPLDTIVSPQSAARAATTDSTPGGRIEDLGLTVTRAAEILGVRRATLSDLLSGRASLSPEMALRLEKAFAVSMDMLLRMQAWYDAAQMRARAGEIQVRRYETA